MRANAAARIAHQTLNARQRCLSVLYTLIVDVIAHQCTRISRECQQVRYERLPSMVNSGKPP